jgi:hypothetical protein
MTHKSFMMLAAVSALMLSRTADAALPRTVIADTFSHNAGQLLGGTTTELGNRTWSSLVSLRILGGKAEWTDVANSADVAYIAPTDRKFSIEAVASDRWIDPPLNQNIALGFADNNPGPPGSNISGRTSLSVTIDEGGFIYIWDNAFAAIKASGKTLVDVGLPLDHTGDIPMLLEMDPVNNTARAEVNNMEVYNIAYTITEPITFAGFAWAGQSSGAWDNFAVRQDYIPEPGSIGLIGVGGLFLTVHRLRHRRRL